MYDVYDYDKKDVQDVLKADVLGRVKVKPEIREQILDEFERGVDLFEIDDFGAITDGFKQCSTRWR